MGGCQAVILSLRCGNGVTGVYRYVLNSTCLFCYFQMVIRTSFGFLKVSVSRCTAQNSPAEYGAKVAARNREVKTQD